MGRFEPRKGVLDLLKAYRILRKTGYDCRLLLVGGGPQEREARRYVATRRLQGVDFLGRVSRRRAEPAVPHRRRLRVARRPGGESFGIVLLEAMAAGTPIVASDIHGYKGVVRRGREALLVPPQGHKGLAEAIGTLLADPDLAAPCRRSGLVRAEEFSWPRVTAKVDDYYGFVDPPPRRHRRAAGALQRADPALAPASRERGLRLGPRGAAPGAGPRLRRSGLPGGPVGSARAGARRQPSPGPGPT